MDSAPLPCAPELPSDASLDECLERFDAAWRAGQPPSLATFLQSVVESGEFREPESRRHLAEELVRIDLEYRWRAAESAGAETRVPGGLPARPRLEDYVAHLPELGTLDELSAGLIADEYWLRQRWGDRPGHAEYAERFPRHGPGLAGALARADAELAREVPAARAPDAAPARVGRYQLLEALGSGAFGTVFRARDTELDRAVAVKLPRAGQFGGRAQEERFLREARSAAQLQHPGIVPVHDVGRAEGALYLVADLVQGPSLALELGERPLSFRQAAELAAQLAEALAYAHSHGVVHRDLKPSNVLLEPLPEGHGGLLPWRPRLSDFGLAKRQAGEVTMTLEGQVLGTPAYMSPEQVRDPHTVDGRSDLYSLGVMLYEMLTGDLPFRGTARMVLQQVLDEEPRAPRRLNDKVPRDLETVTLKLLTKEPARRYPAADDLAADLRRWLAGEPIRARPAGRAERAWRWCRRKPVAAGLVATLAGSVLLLSGAALWLNAARHSERQAKLDEQAQREAAQASEAKAQQARIDEQAQREAAQASAAKAQQARSEAEAVAGFLVDAFRSPDPRADGREVKVADVLDRAAAKLASDKTHDPATKARFLEALGQTYRGLGLPARAVELLEQARALRREALGPDHGDTLASMNHLATAYLAAGRTADAIALHAETLRLTRGRFGLDHDDTLASMNNLALAYREAHQTAKALELQAEILPLVRARFGPDHSDTLTVMNNLALGYHDAGSFAEAVPLYEEVLRLRRATLGTDDPLTLQSMNNLAAVYKDVGRSGEAVPLYEETLGLMKAKLGPDHHVTLTLMNNLALAYRGAGRPADAVAVSEEAVRGLRAKLGSQHRTTILALYNLGLAYRDVDRGAEALPLLEEALQSARAQLGPKHPTTLRALNGLSTAYRETGRVSDCLPLFEEYRAIQQAKLGPENPATLSAMHKLAEAYRAAGRTADSRELFEETLKLRRQKLPADSPDLAATLAGLGGCLLTQGQFAAAELVLREALAIRQKKPKDVRYFDVQAAVGESLAGQGKYADAEPLLVASYEGLQAREAKLPPDIQRRPAEVLGFLVRFYDDWGKPDQAAAWRTRSEERRKAAERIGQLRKAAMILGLLPLAR
jgi:tRNA A-37 threonylcarbamoyl transferase component Bud32